MILGVVALFVQGACMVALPLVALSLYGRRSGAHWSVASAGMLAFVASQVAHLPLLWLLHPERVRPFWVAALVLGLLAGACEELARRVMYTEVVPRARSFRAGVMAGLGHGGVESMLLGLLVLGAGAQALLTKNPAVFLVPWWVRALGVAERAMAMTFHVAASLLVLASLRRRRWGLFVAAFALHALSDAAAVWVVTRYGVVAAEAAVLAFALASAAVIVAMREELRG